MRSSDAVPRQFSNCGDSHRAFIPGIHGQRAQPEFAAVGQHQRRFRRINCGRGGLAGKCQKFPGGRRKPSKPSHDPRLESVSTQSAKKAHRTSLMVFLHSSTSGGGGWVLTPAGPQRVGGGLLPGQPTNGLNGRTAATKNPVNPGGGNKSVSQGRAVSPQFVEWRRVGMQDLFRTPGQGQALLDVISPPSGRAKTICAKPARSRSSHPDPGAPWSGPSKPNPDQASEMGGVVGRRAASQIRSACPVFGNAQNFSVRDGRLCRNVFQATGSCKPAGRPLPPEQQPRRKRPGRIEMRWFVFGL